MKRISRRSLLRARASAPAAAPALVPASGAVALDGTNRRAFLQGTAGAAAGAAVILATPKVASVLDPAGSSVGVEPKAIVTKPAGLPPHEPVTAYVRNAERGEVTVMAGKQETTYRDPALVKRLLSAAR
jgi:hypothetical protein